MSRLFKTITNIVVFEIIVSDEYLGHNTAYLKGYWFWRDSRNKFPKIVYVLRLAVKYNACSIKTVYTVALHVDLYPKKCKI
jgi:hypothetical protein